MSTKYLPAKSYETKCVKMLSTFLHRFSAPGELPRFSTHKFEVKIVETIISCLQTVKTASFPTAIEEKSGQ